MPRLSPHYIKYQNQRINQIEQETLRLNSKFQELNIKLIETISQLQDYTTIQTKLNLNHIKSHLNQPIPRQEETISSFFKKIYVGLIADQQNGFLENIEQIQRIDDSFKNILLLNARKENLIEAFASLSSSDSKDYLVTNLRYICKYFSNPGSNSLVIYDDYRSNYQHSIEAEAIKNKNITINAQYISNLYKFFDLVEQAINRALIGYVGDNNTEMTRAAINLGADCKQLVAGISLTEFSVKNNNSDITKMLFENGAKISPRYSNQSKSLLHHACENGNKEIVKMLLENNADINELIKPVLSWSEWAWEWFVRPIKKIFVDVPELSGTTPLHIAAKHHHIDIVDLLLKAGAKTNITDIKGRDYTKYIGSPMDNDNFYIDQIVNRPAINIKNYSSLKDYHPHLSSNVTWLEKSFASEIYEKPSPRFADEFVEIEQPIPQLSNNNIEPTETNYMGEVPGGVPAGHYPQA